MRNSLARRIEGAKAKDVRERMADIDAASLPTVDEARARQQEPEQQQDEPVAPVDHEPTPASTAEPELLTPDLPTAAEEPDRE